MRVHFLTRYGSRAPSSRLRAYQFVEPLASRGWNARVFPLLRDAYVDRLYRRQRTDYGALLADYVDRFLSLRACLSGCDVVVVEKELFPGLPSFLSRSFERGPAAVLVDYDDAVYAGYERSPYLHDKIYGVMARADGVIAGNRTIQALAMHYNASTFYLPTVIDVARYKVATPRPTARPVVVGWIGTPVTQTLLRPIAKALSAVQQRHGAVIRLIGASPDFKLEGVEVETLAWDLVEEGRQLESIDIGITEPDNENETDKYLIQ